MEWRTQHITERSPTLMETLFGRLFSWHNFDKEYQSPALQYASLVYSAADNQEKSPYPALYSAGGGIGRSITLFDKLPEGLAVKTRLFTEKGWKEVVGHITDMVEDNSHPHVGYRYQLTPREAA